MKKAVLFGASGGGSRLFDRISREYEIVAVTDNDGSKWGGKLRGIPIYKPEACINTADYDSVIIASAPGLETIYSQLVGYGVPEQQIVTSYITAPLESRITFLEKFAELYHTVFPEQTAVAEAGVFAGDFAKEINRCFPGRKLHLFDTFSGFDERDIKKESLYSSAKTGDYSLTSEEAVLSKMRYPENCVVHKGYFPDTAAELADQYGFVNLDLDLYEPTKNGLLYFSAHMETCGIILVHDYFADNFKGPRRAVDEFMREMNQKNLIKMPVGDGISVMICGF
ncbi:TylF/MycF/NovP-related O-methyltransferase [Hungatella hathewayi]|uniref:TylF/MycF/NovP-related O-methyltransferase n=1 Tax=Hungatella hathewayi TaxID=154046 RepID=UPI003569B8E0